MQDASEYVSSERTVLRNRQDELDRKAVGLEKQLRHAMKSGLASEGVSGVQPCDWV